MGGSGTIPLTEAQAAFIAGPRSIFAASRGADGLPSLCRALACKVAADRRSVTVLLHPQRAAALLQDIAASGEIAVVFNEPPTHRTLQIKGRDARPVSTPADAAQSVDAHIEAFAQELDPMGFRGHLIGVVVRGAPEPNGLVPVAVQFTPDAVFEQTPGPRAGARVSGA